MAKWNCFGVAALLVCLLLAHAVEAARDEPASAAGVGRATLPAAAKTVGAGAGIADKKTFWSRGGGSGSDCGCLGGRAGGGGSLGGGVGGIGRIGGGGN